MPILTLLLGTLTGICIATGIILLFTGLRRPGRDRVQILFALFSFSYAGANLTSILEYKATTLETFLRVGDWTAFFTVTTLVFLLWFVSAYTRVTPQLFLWGLTGILSFIGAFAIINPTSIYTEIAGIFTVTFSWGESITRLDASEGLAGVLFFLSELVLIGFLIFACFKQWRRAERRDAFMLGVGLLFLVLALIFDILFIDTGVLNFIYLGDYGFIPLLVIMSLQLSNQVIRMDEELISYRQNLEQMVSQRTQELEEITFSLRRSERQTRALLDAPPDTAMLVTPNGDILATNQIGAMRLGLSAEEAIGINVFEIFGPQVAVKRKRKKDVLLQQKQPIQWEDQRAGRFYWNRMYPVLDEDDEIESIAIFAADITEQKRLQVKEVETAAAEERNRLARDLHDAVTQTIYAASLIVEALPQVWERNPEEGQRNLYKLRQLVRGALAEMRSLLFELRPASLEKASMDTLIQFVADAFTGRTRVPVTLEVAGFGELPANVKIAFYRISQEVFNNISKHAEATSVEVNLKMGNNAVALSIMDNGIGFDTRQNRKPGMGLLIMGERAAKIGAQLDIESRRGYGTQIDLSWAETNEEKFDE